MCNKGFAPNVELIRGKMVWRETHMLMTSIWYYPCETQLEPTKTPAYGALYHNPPPHCVMLHCVLDPSPVYVERGEQMQRFQ